MPRFRAMDLVRGFALTGSADRKGAANSKRRGAEPYGQIQLAASSAEMAEQFVSDVSVRECVLRCGGLSRGCGIPADDLCLLAMQGASQSAGRGGGDLPRGKYGSGQAHRYRGSRRRNHAQPQALPTE
jgi:hypothetical protein